MDEFDNSKKEEDRFADLFEDDSSAHESQSSHNEDQNIFEMDDNLIAEVEYEGDNDMESQPISEIKTTKDSEFNEDSNSFMHSLSFGEKLDLIKKRETEKMSKKDKKLEKKKETLKAFVLFSTIIMRNPYHYQNFVKLYILCMISKNYFFTKFARSEHILALVLSKLPLAFLKNLEEVKKRYQDNPKANFRPTMHKLSDFTSTFFPYDKYNEDHILFNLSDNHTYPYEQILQIFYALCKYVGVPVRIVSIIDMRNLNVDKRHYVSIEGMKPIRTRAVRRRKLEEIESSSKDTPIVEEIKPVKPKEKKAKLNKKTLGTMISNFTTSIADTKSTADDSELDMNDKSIFEISTDMGSASRDKDSSFGFMNSASNSMANFDAPNMLDFDKNDLEFESKLSSFRFGSKSISIVQKETPAKKEKKAKKVTGIKKVEKQETMEIQEVNEFESQVQKPKKVAKSNIGKYAFGKKTSLDNGELDLSEYKCWVEVWDFEEERWVQVEPLKNKIYENLEEINKRLHGMPGLFIMTFQKYSFKEGVDPKPIEKHKRYYIRDVTSNYIKRCHKTTVSRRELGLDYWWNQIVTYFKFDPNLSDDFWVKVNQLEDERIQAIEKQDIPQTPKEFRYSKYYILASMLKKHDGLRPEAKPLETKFKDEPIYERSMITKLHSKARWKREMRKVKPGEEPVKKVLVMGGQGETLVELYGEWQTEEFLNELNPDGTLPRNEYGNFEIFNGPLPKGVVHINLPGLPRICKKLGIEYVDAVVDFETGKNGRPHAVKGGIIAHEKDENLIREAYEQYREETLRKEEEKSHKEILGLWKGIFRKILIKKYIQETYKNDE